MIQILIIVLILLINNWVFRIFSQNILIGSLVVATSISLYFYLKREKYKYLIISILLFLPILFFQIWTTAPYSLTNLDNDEQRVQQIRIREYKPTYIPIFYKILWLYPDKWIEKRTEIIVYQRILNNLFDNLNLNQFFFAGFPRPRVGIIEFEKFSYLLLPFFIIGAYLFFKKSRIVVTLIFFVIPLLIMSLISNRDLLGPFSLFPFYINLIFIGVINSLKSKKKLAIFVILFLIVFMQTYFYEHF